VRLKVAPAIILPSSCIYHDGVGHRLCCVSSGMWGGGGSVFVCDGECKNFLREGGEGERGGGVLGDWQEAY